MFVQLGYWERCSVHPVSQHSTAVPVSWMPRNLGERDRILNSVMAPREKDVVLGRSVDIWLPQSMNSVGMFDVTE